MSKTLNLHTAESEFSNFMIENVGEIETEFENTFFIRGLDGVRS